MTINNRREFLKLSAKSSALFILYTYTGPLKSSVLKSTTNDFWDCLLYTSDAADDA